MSEGWDPAAPGVLTLPSGRRVRGRGRGSPLPPGPLPEFGVYLLGRRPEPVPWGVRWAGGWVRGRASRPPADREDVGAALLQLGERAVDERVEVACHGGT